MICGGENLLYEQISNLCYTVDNLGDLDEPHGFIEAGTLETGRIGASSVAIGSKLWVTGGFNPKNYEVNITNSRLNNH